VLLTIAKADGNPLVTKKLLGHSSPTDSAMTRGSQSRLIRVKVL
jgi:hypothetical protein